VQAIRQGRANINSAYIRIRGGEAWLIGANIPLSVHSAIKDYDPTRVRKVLLHKDQLVSLGSKIASEKLTLVPISLYTKGRLVKAEIGLGKGKKEYQKKEVRRRRDMDLDAERAIRDKDDANRR
jgi:SsrA-binding protein